MKYDANAVFILGATVAPFGVLFVAVHLDRARRRKFERPPQTEKLLRPPGHSLSVQFEEEFFAIFFDILKAMFLGCTSGILAVMIYHSAAVHAPAWWLSICVLLLGLFVIACWMATRQAFLRFQKARDLQLGLHGEQAVAEALNETAESGFRSFHDLQTDRVGNLDHVTVGTRGVFVIETKARSRHASHNGQAEHEVVYDGKFLQFPYYRDAKPIEQARINAKWLSNFLEKKTGEPVWVEPLVVLPGWYVQNSQSGSFPVKVMNANYLPGFLQRQPEKLETAHVRRIIAALDEKCRDVEF